MAIAVDSLAGVLIGFHAGIAALTASKQWELQDAEAQELAKASANVLRHYNVEATAKTLDWINLAQLAAMIYGSRFYAWQQERRANEAKPVDTSRQDFGLAS